jgi:hypothetical protein
MLFKKLLCECTLGAIISRVNNKRHASSSLLYYYFTAPSAAKNQTNLTLIIQTKLQLRLMVPVPKDA